MDREEMLKELLVDEDEEFKKLIELSKQLIGINNKSGSIVIKIPTEKLTDLQLIILFMIGSSFSYQLKLRESAEVTSKEISEFFNKDPQIISARLSDLKRERKVKSQNRGTYSLEPFSLKEDLESIIKKVM